MDNDMCKLSRCDFGSGGCLRMRSQVWLLPTDFVATASQPWWLSYSAHLIVFFGGGTKGECALAFIYTHFSGHFVECEDVTSMSERLMSANPNSIAAAGPRSPYHPDVVQLIIVPAPAAMKLWNLFF